MISKIKDGVFVFLCQGFLTAPRLALASTHWTKSIPKVSETMGKKRKQLSQAEVWDDSALIQSWDDALEEYKVSDVVDSNC